MAPPPQTSQLSWIGEAHRLPQTIEAGTHWEFVARKRWGAYITEIEKRVLLEAQGTFGRPTDALEIGCEGGRWTRLLADLGWKMSCTDIDAAALDICRQRVPGATCVRVSADDTTLPFASHSFDLLLCIEVFDVVWRDWLATESHRLLRENGCIVGVFNNRRSARGYLRSLMASVRRERTSYRIAYSAWRDRFRQMGFQLVHEEGLCWFPFRRHSDSRLVGAFTGLEKCLGLRRLVSLSPWIVFVARRRVAEGAA